MTASLQPCPRTALRAEKKVVVKIKGVTTGQPRLCLMPWGYELGDHSLGTTSLNDRFLDRCVHLHLPGLFQKWRLGISQLEVLPE